MGLLLIFLIMVIISLNMENPGCLGTSVLFLFIILGCALIPTLGVAYIIGFGLVALFVIGWLIKEYIKYCRDVKHHWDD